MIKHIVFICSFVCSVLQARATEIVSPEDSPLIVAAKAEIEFSQASGSTDTQCSNYVTRVLNRTGVPIRPFHSNDFDKVAPRYFPQAVMVEFKAENLALAREALRTYLNSLPDHTSLIAQWPRTGQSGHVAIVEKVTRDQFMIYQAQGGLRLPHSAPVRITSLLYGALPVQRSHIRLWLD